MCVDMFVQGKTIQACLYHSSQSDVPPHVLNDCNDCCQSLIDNREYIIYYVFWRDDNVIGFIGV